MRARRRMAVVAGLPLLAGGLIAGGAGGLAGASRPAARPRAGASSGAGWDVVAGEYTSHWTAEHDVLVLARASVHGFSATKAPAALATPGTIGTAKTVQSLRGPKGTSATPARYVVERRYGSKSAAEREVQVLRAKGFVADAVPSSGASGASRASLGLARVAGAEAVARPVAAAKATPWDVIVCKYSSPLAAKSRVAVLGDVGIRGFRVLTTTMGTPTPGTLGTPQTAASLGAASRSGSAAPSREIIHVVMKHFGSEALAKAEVHVLRYRGFVAWAIPAKAV